MATDGVKIIDGDTAHDTYSGIIDLYDSGATIEAIKAKVPFPFPYGDDDFENEVYTTAYALAMWEIGYLTGEILHEVKKVIDKGTGVKVWTDECDEKMGKRRQKELDKFWNKINSPNSKIRKRKKHKTITNFLFEINDVLAFQLPDKNYCATILLEIHQHRGHCSYIFGKIIYKSGNIPTISEITESEIVGRKIPTSGVDTTKIVSMGFEEIVKQGGLQKILEREGERTGNYIIGLSKTFIEHEDLLQIKDKFRKIGKIDLSRIKETGSFGGTSTYEGFIEDYQGLESRIKAFDERKFKIKDLLE